MFILSFSRSLASTVNLRARSTQELGTQFFDLLDCFQAISSLPNYGDLEVFL
jgi:hypothetical protein